MEQNNTKFWYNRIQNNSNNISNNSNLNIPSKNTPINDIGDFYNEKTINKNNSIPQNRSINQKSLNIFALIVSFLITIFIWKDLYLIFFNIFNIVKSTALWQSYNFWISDITQLYNMIIWIFVVLIIFAPEILNKNFRNPIFLYTKNILEKILLIFADWIFNFIQDKDHLLKIIYYWLVLLITLISYHYVIDTIFLNNWTILKTLSYWFMLIFIIWYTNIISQFINQYHNIDTTNDRKTMWIFTFYILLYSLWSIIVLYFAEGISLNIYNFLENIELLRYLN